MSINAHCELESAVNGCVKVYCNDGTTFDISTMAVIGKASVMVQLGTKIYDITVRDGSINETLENHENKPPEEPKDTKCKFNWTKLPSLAFFDAYEAVNKKKYSSKKLFYQAMETEMKNLGYIVDWEQLQSKYKSLQRLYLNVTRHNEKTGVEPRTMEFEDEMEKLFGKQPNINPVATYDSSTGFKSKSNTLAIDDIAEFNEEYECENENRGQSSSVMRRKRRPGQTATILAEAQNTMKEFMEETKQRRLEHARFENRMLELQDREVQSAVEFRTALLMLLKEKNDRT